MTLRRALRGSSTGSSGRTSASSARPWSSRRTRLTSGTRCEC